MNQYVFEEERPVVDTKCGKIRGIAYGGVNIFMNSIEKQKIRCRLKSNLGKELKMPIMMTDFKTGS